MKPSIQLFPMPFCVVSENHKLGPKPAHIKLTKNRVEIEVVYFYN
jgi:hypothetical protein